jgi:hypothetical protein
MQHFLLGLGSTQLLHDLLVLAQPANVVAVEELQ